jgi:hypothetical protein
MTPAQENYLDLILDKSDEDLLYEIARHTIAPIMASGDTRSQQGPKRFPIGQLPSQARLNQVPSAPVPDSAKPALTSFLGIAQSKVNAMRSRLYAALCDSATQAPNEWAVDISTGQRKEIVVAVATALLTKYATEMSIGIPVAIYYLKKGLASFCAAKH